MKSHLKASIGKVPTDWHPEAQWSTGSPRVPGAHLRCLRWVTWMIWTAPSLLWAHLTRWLLHRRRHLPRHRLLLHLWNTIEGQMVRLSRRTDIAISWKPFKLANTGETIGE